MTQITCFILITVATLFIEIDGDKTIELHTKNGDILGKIESTVFHNEDFYAFRGVPYAEPPVDKLRFQSPVPHKGWGNTLEALVVKPTCLQYSGNLRNKEPPGISGSEDCLYLNIFTPNLKGNAPIIVFDYNVYFKTGFNGTKTYAPDNFIDEEVVVVTINHRFDIFGYLTTEDDVIPGNNGLRDFILGLQWVKENIREFGGNPDKVTLMGSSSGAALVELMLYTEKAKGLFHGAIIQSGTALETNYFPTNIRELAFKLGKRMSIDTKDSSELLDGLQKVDGTKLLLDVIPVLTEYAEAVRKLQITAHAFTPIIEKTSDAVLTVLPEEGNIINDVPVIIGFNSREGLDYASHYLRDPRIIPEQLGDSMVAFPIRSGFRFELNTDVYKEANTEIKEFYLNNKLDYYTLLKYTEYVGDIKTGYAIRHATQTLSERLKSPVYHYMFDYRGQLNENMHSLTRYMMYKIDHWGATVTDELCYLFICSRMKKDYVQLTKSPSKQKEQRVMESMVRMWSNFAKYGIPTPDDDSLLKGFKWKPVKEKTDLNYLHVTKTLKMTKNPLGDRAKFWDDFLAKYAKKAVDGVVKGKPLEELKEEPQEDLREEL